VLILGVATWLICLPRLATLAELLYFTGAFVASTIWPIAAGLYWRRVNRLGATAGMALGTICGLIGYFQIGFYVAALISAAVSMALVVITTLVRPHAFDWADLDPARRSA
jgi:Na+/proline symporter